MKTLIYRVLGGVLLPVTMLLLAGCYRDLGNYDYTLGTMNEIKSVTFSPSVFAAADGNVIEVQQAMNEDDRTRRVEAVVEQLIK